MKRHDLKCWPGPFGKVVAGVKRHEIRVNDRNYRPGDSVVLHEFNPDDGLYTGRTSSWLIGALSDAEWGLPSGICCFSLLPEIRAEQFEALGLLAQGK